MYVLIDVLIPFTPNWSVGRLVASLRHVKDVGKYVRIFPIHVQTFRARQRPLGSATNEFLRRNMEILLAGVAALDHLLAKRYR